MIYPKGTKSLVHVVFTDGEMKTYPCTASPGIGRYFSRELQAGAVAIFMPGWRTVVLTSEEVRHMEIEPYEPGIGEAEVGTTLRVSTSTYEGHPRANDED